MNKIFKQPNVVYHLVEKVDSTVDNPIIIMRCGRKHAWNAIIAEHKFIHPLQIKLYGYVTCPTCKDWIEKNAEGDSR